jgi:hypothetical protein
MASPGHATILRNRATVKAVSARISRAGGLKQDDRLSRNSQDLSPREMKNYGNSQVNPSTAKLKLRGIKRRNVKD